METQSVEENGIEVLKIFGKLDTNTAMSVETKISEILGASKNKLLIDLKETNFISSSGLRVLLTTSKKISQRDGVLIICSPNSLVEETFSISGFDQILNVASTKEEAMEVFRSLE